ncbi:uncharacterized protein LOC112555229 [Pomacea canaliculata]|uniref:uncharacterized protein LOC112555229 n=1 Tax=Pomacea canaliculata TaxID=400727 RepID=UPI000D739A38|nr:uncharacterized protein LOC112555229 [Pomacea canaliculata]
MSVITWQVLVVVTIASLVVGQKYDRRVTPEQCRDSNIPFAQYTYQQYLQQRDLYIRNNCSRYVRDDNDKRQVLDARARQFIYLCFLNYHNTAVLVDRCNQTIRRLGLTFSTPPPLTTAGTTVTATTGGTGTTGTTTVTTGGTGTTVTDTTVGTETTGTTTVTDTTFGIGTTVGTGG